MVTEEQKNQQIARAIVRKILQTPYLYTMISYSNVFTVGIEQKNNVKQYIDKKADGWHVTLNIYSVFDTLTHKSKLFEGNAEHKDLFTAFTSAAHLLIKDLDTLVVLKDELKAQYIKTIEDLIMWFSSINGNGDEQNE